MYKPVNQSVYISIHALREEGDLPLADYSTSNTSFLSTPSARRATRRLRNASWCEAISIHALREEGDEMCLRLTAKFSYFYPRPPRGGRLLFSYCAQNLNKFLSTPSARRATSFRRLYVM